MPGPSYLRGKLVNIALTCGKLTEKDIDRSVRRILHSIYRLLPQMPVSKMGEKELDPNAKRSYLREAASSAIVLMKNESHVLPFHKERSVGADAKFYSRETLTMCRLQSLGRMLKLQRSPVVVALMWYHRTQ